MTDYDQHRLDELECRCQELEEQRDVERERAECAEKAAAEMREALQSVLETPDAEIHDLEHALSADAGLDYHHRDEYKPLVEAALALEKLDWCIGYELSEPMHDVLDKAQRKNIEALSNARAKGLIP